MLSWGFSFTCSRDHCRLVTNFRISWLPLDSLTTAEFCFFPFLAVALCQMHLICFIEEITHFCVPVEIEGGFDVGWHFLCCLCVLVQLSEIRDQHKGNEVGAHGRQVELWLNLCGSELLDHALCPVRSQAEWVLVTLTAKFSVIYKFCGEKPGFVTDFIVSCASMWMLLT